MGLPMFGHARGDPLRACGRDAWASELVLSPPTPTESGFARSTIETWRNASVIAISRVGKMDVRENRWIARRGIRLRTTAETRFEREMAFVVELRLAGSTRMSTIASEAAHVGRE